MQQKIAEIMIGDLPVFHESAKKWSYFLDMCSWKEVTNFTCMVYYKLPVCLPDSYTQDPGNLEELYSSSITFKVTM